jgi:hypothetical protein
MILYKGYYPTFWGIFGKRGDSGKKLGEIQKKRAKWISPSFFAEPPSFSRSECHALPDPRSEAIEERYQRAPSKDIS